MQIHYGDGLTRLWEELEVKAQRGHEGSELTPPSNLRSQVCPAARRDVGDAPGGSPGSYRLCLAAASVSSLGSLWGGPGTTAGQQASSQEDRGQGGGQRGQAGAPRPLGLPVTMAASCDLQRATVAASLPISKAPMQEAQREAFWETRLSALPGWLGPIHISLPPLCGLGQDPSRPLPLQYLLPS